MKRNLEIFLECTMMIPFALCIMSTHQLFGQQNVPNDKVTQISVVTDIDGKDYEVSDLIASYSVPGYILGGPESKGIKSIMVVLSFNEGRVWTHEELNYPFNSTKGIEFKDGALNRIEMSDGSLVICIWDSTTQKHIMEQTDAAGKKKRVECDGIYFQAGELQGKGYDLVSFKGRGIGASGREGDFFISVSDIRRIVFRQVKP